jgi:pimeloyl-ACP methyl ester carboxylesterase
VAGGIDFSLPGSSVRLAATRWVPRASSGAPVLLLHGLASQRRFWNLVVPHLADLPLLALDARGHGDSERPESPYDFATLVSDLLTALDAAGLDRVVAVGHSWGANLAVSVAAAHPERVLSVVALDGGFVSLGSRDRQATRHALAPPVLAEPVASFEARVARGALGPYWSPPVADAVLPAYTVGADGLVRARFPREAHLQVVEALLGYRAEELLGSVRCPAWFVSCGGVGADDEWARVKEAALSRAGELLSRPRLLRLAGAVHDVPLQWPALVAGVVRSAVADLGVRE